MAETATKRYRRRVAISRVRDVVLVLLLAGLGLGLGYGAGHHRPGKGSSPPRVELGSDQARAKPLPAMARIGVPPMLPAPPRRAQQARDQGTGATSTGAGTATGGRVGQATGGTTTQKPAEDPHADDPLLQTNPP